MQEQFLTAYDDYSDALFRHCVFHVRDKEGAKDLVQETFTRTWDHIAKGGEIDNFRAFLYRTLKNLIIDGYRKKTTDSLDAMMEAGFDSPSEDDKQVLRGAETREALEAIERLDADDREVLLLRFVDGLEPKEIAEVLGSTANAVSIRITRATAKVREMLTSPSISTT